MIVNPQDSPRNDRGQVALSAGVCGTLVVAIPCREGLLVAADRRSTLRGEQVDGASKLEALNGSPATVITVTGTGEFIGDPPAGQTAASWLANAPRKFDARLLLKTAIDRRERTLDPETLRGVADELVSEFRTFFGSYPPTLLGRYAGAELCRAVIFQCRDGNPLSRIIATFAVTISNSQQISAANEVVRIFASEEPFEVCKFGETEYVNEHVLAGRGRMSLSSKLTGLLTASSPVGAFPVADAEYVARGLIIAAEIASASIPIPSGSGIGGGMTVFLIRRDRAELRDSIVC